MPWWNDEFLDLQYGFDILPKWLLCAGVGILLALFGEFMKPPRLKDCHNKELVPFNMTGPEVWNPLCTALLTFSLRHYLLYVVMPTWSAENKRSLYPILVIGFVTLTSFNLLYMDGLVGNRPMNEETCARIAHVSSVTSYAAWAMPRRSCKDTDPRKTLLDWPFAQSVGCDSTVLASTFPRFIPIQFLYSFLRADWKTAFAGAVVKVVALVAVLIGTGSYGWHMVYGAGMHFVMGCVSAYMCYLCTEEARSQFAQAKHAKFGRHSESSAV